MRHSLDELHRGEPADELSARRAAKQAIDVCARSTQRNCAARAMCAAAANPIWCGNDAIRWQGEHVTTETKRHHNVIKIGVSASGDSQIGTVELTRNASIQRRGNRAI
jgi:hypothetical protein